MLYALKRRREMRKRRACAVGGSGKLHGKFVKWCNLVMGQLKTRDVASWVTTTCYGRVCFTVWTQFYGHFTDFNVAMQSYFNPHCAEVASKINTFVFCRGVRQFLQRSSVILCSNDDIARATDRVENWIPTAVINAVFTALHCMQAWSSWS